MGDVRCGYHGCSWYCQSISEETQQQVHSRTQQYCIAALDNSVVQPNLVNCHKGPTSDIALQLQMKALGRHQNMFYVVEEEAGVLLRYYICKHD